MNETAHTAKQMQEQMKTLVQMRSWFEIPSKSNDEKKERIDAKREELRRRVHFLVEALAKERAERERKQKNKEKKDRRRKAIEDNSPVGLSSAEQEEPDGWWYTDGIRQAQKKIERDTREAALKQAGESEAPDPVEPEKIELPSRDLSKAGWLKQINELLAKFGWLAIDENNKQRAKVERLVAAYQAN